MFFSKNSSISNVVTSFMWEFQLDCNLWFNHVEFETWSGSIMFTKFQTAVRILCRLFPFFAALRYFSKSILTSAQGCSVVMKISTQMCFKSLLTDGNDKSPDMINEQIFTFFTSWWMKSSVRQMKIIYILPRTINVIIFPLHLLHHANWYLHFSPTIACVKSCKWFKKGALPASSISSESVRKFYHNFKFHQWFVKIPMKRVPWSSIMKKSNNNFSIHE